jgi:hypothetical protein
VDLGPRWREGVIFLVLGSSFGGATLRWWRRHRETCGSGVVRKDFFCCGDLRIIKKLYQRLFLILRLWDGCSLIDPFGDFPSVTNNVRLA